MKFISIPLGLIIFTLLLSVNTYAQSPIGSFYGMELNCNKYAIETGVRSQGKTGVWKTTTDGQSYYFVSSPVLGGCGFQGASFYLKGGVLDEAVFFSADGGLYDPNFSGPINGYQQFLNKSRSYESIFRTLKASFLSKYGAPLIETDGKLVWRYRRNQLILEYEFRDESESYGMRFCDSRVAVTYEIYNSKDDNF